VSEEYTNRLIGEKSPYLLQHAHNPVDWHAWGEEAFEKARSEEKPIFLSVGYSTCHWCHVMERESFENEETARVLNESFVPVKVDREERPDVDRVYMTFVQATTGSGGWPMSVWLTPELQPFAGGTYFPPEDRYGRPGFVTVLRRLAEVWRNERERVMDQAARITAMLKDYAMPRGEGGELGEEIARNACRQAAEAFDGELGRIWWRAEVSAARHARFPARVLPARAGHGGWAAGAGDGVSHAADDGRGRDARSTRRGISPVLGGPFLACAAL
jgi:uncharacterized protein YyaL (SSP411 family)